MLEVVILLSAPMASILCDKMYVIALRTIVSQKVLTRAFALHFVSQNVKQKQAVRSTDRRLIVAKPLMIANP